jgi:hypothetical protein
MLRFFVAVLALTAMAFQIASADEIRHTEFLGTMLGTWAPSSDQCATNAKSKVVIEMTKYHTADGSCAVRWIVETAGSRGANYAVHAQCDGASAPARPDTVNLILRPEGNDRVSIGKSFEDLKPYLRCPAP